MKVNTSSTEDTLKDCGCSDEMIRKFMCADKQQQLNILKKHKKTLLNDLHEKEKQIDCLDYLKEQVYR